MLYFVCARHKRAKDSASVKDLKANFLTWLPPHTDLKVDEKWIVDKRKLDFWYSVTLLKSNSTATSGSSGCSCFT